MRPSEFMLSRGDISSPPSVRAKHSCCRYNDPPGFVRNGAALEPCPDCGGTMVAHCCDGLTACNDVDAAMASDAADEARYQVMS